MKRAFLPLLAVSFSLPLGLPALSQTPNTEQFRQKVNDNVVFLMGGQPGATFNQLANDISLVVSDGYKLRVLSVEGGAAVQNVEEVLYLHPAVAEAAVIGVSHPIFGEEICAVIQNRPGLVTDGDEIRAHVAQHLAKFKVPGRVVFRGSLPKNSTGKVQKRILREQITASAVAA